MPSKVDKSALLILLIPTAIVAAGLVWALTTAELGVIAFLLLVVGAMVWGFVRARVARGNSASHSK